MQFLDAIGLAYFWEKIKSWVGKNYLSLKGGTVHGDVNIDNGGLTVTTEEGINLKEHDTSPRNVSLRFVDGLVFSQAEGDGSDYSEKAHYDSSEAKTGKFVKNGGTATQALIADGSVKEIGSANGIAGLDANGNVPLANLGNLDTTVAEVVAALPTSNIKRHIYLVKDSDTANNKYAEYVYTGDISAAYDSTKWEKFGDFRTTVDLADYAKKSETLSSISIGKAPASGYNNLILRMERNNYTTTGVVLPVVGNNTAGLMTPADLNKLNGIAPNANNYSLPLAANGTLGGIQLGYEANGRNYPVQLSGEKAYVNVPWTDTNTTYDLSPYAKTADVNAALSKKVDVVSGKGLSTEDFTAALKTKLNGIATGATADSAIPTSVIDALN